jgi:hypothetical protein
MATNSPQPGSNKQPDPSMENNQVDGASTRMLDDATHGQTLDPENDGQQYADLQDDSLRMDSEALKASGPARATDENLPRELTKPSDVAFTLPEENS